LARFGSQGDSPIFADTKIGTVPGRRPTGKTPQELGYQPMGTSRHEPHWPRPGPLGRSRADVRMTAAPVHFLASDIANGWPWTANTAVPAEFAGRLAAERFIGNAGRNRVLFSGRSSRGIGDLAEASPTLFLAPSPLRFRRPAGGPTGSGVLYSTKGGRSSSLVLGPFADGFRARKRASTKGAKGTKRGAGRL
jgi:hypothetical protein